MTKQRLQEYLWLKQNIIKIEEIDTILTKTTMTLSDMHKGNSPRDLTNDLLAKKVDLQNTMKKGLTKSLIELKEIEQAIDALPTRERFLFRLRYLEGRKWDDIFIEFGYSERQTHQIHGDMLKNMAGFKNPHSISGTCVVLWYSKKSKNIAKHQHFLYQNLPGSRSKKEGKSKKEEEFKVKKTLTVLLIAIIIISLLTACGISKGNDKVIEEETIVEEITIEEVVEEDVAEAPVELTEFIKIGILSPLSGPGSVHGIPVKQAALLAAEKINAAGGIDEKGIEIIAYDTKGDAAEAVNAYKNLKDKVVAIVGGAYSGATLGFKDLAVTDGIPVLSPTASYSEVTLNAPNVFRACYTDAYQGSVAAKFALDNLGSTTPGVLYIKNDLYSEGLAKSFEAYATAAGVTVEMEAYTAEDKDYSTQLSKIEAAGVDVLFLPHYPYTVGPILAQVAEMGLDVTCLGGDGCDGIQYDYAAESEGFYFSNHYTATDTASIVQDFVSSYEEEYGETPIALSALAYDAVYLMAAAIDTADSTDADKIVSALTSSSLEGVTGDFTFDTNGDPIKSIAMLKVVYGKLILDSKVTAN